ncbi:N-lysine methyltransferase SMYD2-B [Sphaceloma murrayae]|uniref:N-lysine methyltransferase SMYD2-B n=1 Tax=Sphaceloma murrayae TaxID=2082308 RepID=A0A2K1R2E7_9PEZI|nr:N-lysine methyltransferase SMYD2-B [Sphaceloma murrayae]
MEQQTASYCSECDEHDKNDSPMDVDFPMKEAEEIYRSDLLVVRSTPHAGLGLFALAPIPAGTRLISERPLVSLPDMADLPDLHAQVSALPPSRSQLFWSLAAYRRRHEEVDWIPAMRASYSGPSSSFDALCDAVLSAWLIYETNRFTVRSPSGARDRMGIFPLAARLNHSCRPNVFHRHNHLIDRLTIHALRDIEQGEELCTSYIDIVHPTKERRRILRHWGFKCMCHLCRSAEAGSELRRKRLEDMTRRMRKEETRRAMMEWTEWDYAKALGVLEDMVRLMDEEDMVESDSVGEVLGLGAEYAMGLGWWDMAREWAARALEVEERSLGRDSSEWAEARERLTAAEKGP